MITTHKKKRRGNGHYDPATGDPPSLSPSLSLPLPLASHLQLVTIDQEAKSAPHHSLDNGYIASRIEKMISPKKVFHLLSLSLSLSPCPSYPCGELFFVCFVLMHTRCIPCSIIQLDTLAFATHCTFATKCEWRETNLSSTNIK